MTTFCCRTSPRGDSLARDCTRARPVPLESGRALGFLLLAHVLIGKPVPTFPGRALAFSLVAVQQGNEPLDNRGRRARHHVGHRRDLLAARGPYDLELLALHVSEEGRIAHRRIESTPQDVEP